MAYNEQVSTLALRAEYVDSAVKGIAERLYKFKQSLNIQTTSAWKNTIWQENPNPLVNAGGLSIKVPRGAQPPQGKVKFNRKTVEIDKYMFEDIILWEDILTDEISVQSRTLYRIAEKVTKDVDDTIWTDLTTQDATIQLVTIAAGKHWSGSSAAIIDDIMNARTLIASSNYDVSNCTLYLNPRDYRSIVRWVTDKGAQFNALSEEAARNGRVPGLSGVTFIQSNSVAASQALMVVPKICATWYEAVSFRTTTIEDPYISLKVRAVEEGKTNITDPQAIVWIKNTRGDDT